MQGGKKPFFIQFATLEFESLSDEALKTRAQKIVPAGKLDRPGHSVERRRSYWAGRAAAGYLLESVLVSASGNATILPNAEWGYLRVWQNGREAPCHVNISHTKRIAAAVVGPTPIGIDIEAIDRDASRVLARAASEEERKKLPPQIVVGKRAIAAPVALWSAKEAVSKALGLGIKFGLQHLVVDFSVGPPYPVEPQISGPLKVSSPAVLFFLRGNILISLCSDRKTLSNGVHDAGSS